MINKSGYTLVEVVSAAVIFLLVLISVLGVFLMSVDASKRVNYEYGATTLAKNRIERMKNMDFSVINDASETDTRINSEGTADINGQYLRSTQITPNYGGNSLLLRVDVSVYYEYRGVKNTVPAVMSYVFVDDN